MILVVGGGPNNNDRVSVFVCTPWWRKNEIWIEHGVPVFV